MKTKKEEDSKNLVPTAIRNNIGSMLIEKGVTDDGLLKLYQWDAVDECSQQQCPAFNRCKAEKHGSCTMQLSYVKSMLDLVYRNYDEYITEPLLFKIGMHILPSYKMFSKILIAEMGVGRVLDVTVKGVTFVNPIYKELREQVKNLTFLWHDLGLPIHPGQIKASIGENYAD